MSASNTRDSNDTPSAGSTVEQAAANIATILARESGEPEERDEEEGAAQPEEQTEGEQQADDDEATTQGDEDGEEPSEEPEAEDGEGTDEEGEEPDEPEATAKAITIELDGKPVTLTADEVRQGYLRQADYTRKTTALAEERRTFQGHAQAVVTERQQYAALLPVLEQQIKSLMPQEPDWDRLAVEDPVEFNRQWAAKQMRDAKLTAIQAEQHRLSSLQQQEAQQQTAQQIAAEREKLVNANPQWSNPERWTQDRQAVRDYLAGYGYSADEIGAVTDHRAVVIAHKARLYDAMMKRGTKPGVVVKPQQQAPRPVPKQGAPAPKPGTAPMRRPPSELTRAKMRLAKTHSLTDAARVIERLL
jgi:hypothetical protein